MTTNGGQKVGISQQCLNFPSKNLVLGTLGKMYVMASLTPFLNVRCYFAGQRLVAPRLCYACHHPEGCQKAGVVVDVPFFLQRAISVHKQGSEVKNIFRLIISFMGGYRISERGGSDPRDLPPPPKLPPECYH